MEKVFGIVILYKPGADVVKNMATYLPYVEQLLVVDNSEPAAAVDVSILGDKAVLLQDGVNRGIAARLNAAADLALAQGAHWLLTMDQDSCFEQDSIKAYLQCFNQFENKNPVAMFGVEYEKEPAILNCDAVKTDLLITSGSLVNVPVCKSMGGFDEKLFIDEVDGEYCFRAAANGFTTIKFNNIFLNHSLGTIGEHRSLKNMKKTPRTLHSPLRIYYMVRNYWYVRDKYKANLPETLGIRKAALLNRIKNNFLYGKNRFMLVKYLWLAYRHYKKGRMGKFGQ